MTISALMKDVLAVPLKEFGFLKKSNNWYWSNEEVVLVVNLQKSQYGEQYYVNCGVALNVFSDEKFPKEHLCDIRFRLSAVVPKEQREECEAAFNLENSSISDAERLTIATNFFESYGLSILMSCQSLASIADAYKTEKLPAWTMSRKVADYLQKQNL